MAKYSTDFEYMQLNTRDIVVSENYQRDVRARKVQFNKIMKTFDPRKVNEVKVSHRGGKYYCIDGQMTMAVLKARNNGRDLLVNCKVYQGLTELDEKDLFVAQRGTSVGVSSMDKMRAEFNFGDENVTNLVHLCEMNGVTLEWNRSVGKNKVVAFQAIYDIYVDCGNPAEFSTFLEIIKKSWDGDSDSFRKEIMHGVWLFMKTYRGQYSVQTLIKKLQKVSPKSIIREAKVSTASGNRKYAIQILNAYNRNASANRLPDLL